VAALSALAAAFAFDLAPAAALQAVQIGTFRNPVHVAVAPGFSRLLFVVERPGQIQVLRDEVDLPLPFLNIEDLVLGRPDAAAGTEQGLLSVAFPADYPETRRFYVFFTNNNWDLEIDEFKRSATNPVRADRATRRILLVIPHRQARNHNGGQLQFGPDGLLYISTGEGGAGAGEPARQLTSLLGKILRINPLPGPTLPYRIPSQNPYVGKVGRDEIYAYGLRNPWRFSFDGNLIAIGDVGQNRREEVNLLPRGQARGANFGWPQFEGELVFDNSRPGPDPATFPIFTYSHVGGRCSITGGYIVHDPTLPSLAGRYLYGDYCTGGIRSFIPNVAAQEVSDDKSTGLTLPGLTSFGRGFNGQIYFAQTREDTGSVKRLEVGP
jgi:glucose/arabinose dehydrogenase